MEIQLVKNNKLAKYQYNKICLKCDTCYLNKLEKCPICEETNWTKRGIKHRLKDFIRQR